MSWRSDSSQLFAGKWTSSLYAGHGVQAQNIPATGDSGPAFLYADIAEYDFQQTDEIRALFKSLPSNGDFDPNEDSSFTYTGPDGLKYADYEGFVNGVSYGEFTVTLSTGSQTYTIEATAGSFNYSGLSATVLMQRMIVAEGNSFSVSGSAATMQILSPGIYTINATGASFTYQPSSATLKYILPSAIASETALQVKQRMVKDYFAQFRLRDK